MTVLQVRKQNVLFQYKIKIYEHFSTSTILQPKTGVLNFQNRCVKFSLGHPVYFIMWYWALVTNWITIPRIHSSFSILLYFIKSIHWLLSLSWTKIVKFLIWITLGSAGFLLGPKKRDHNYPAADIVNSWSAFLSLTMFIWAYALE